MFRLLLATLVAIALVAPVVAQEKDKTETTAPTTAPGDVPIQPVLVVGYVITPPVLVFFFTFLLMLVVLMVQIVFLRSTIEKLVPPGTKP